jgi:transcriptional regulator with PAS, ATPase and Fis domain
LFGYEEGAFSGAGKKGKPGKIELANSGGFFLDEIGDMPMPMQSKLLRVIQNKEIERLGGTRKRRVDVRFIAATNADLEKKMQRNEFRSDLYYRLSVITLTLPPLRDRKSDIPLLIENYLCELNKKYNTEKKITSRAKQMLQEYKWPGNVRELHNIIECAFVFAEDNVIDIINFPNKITISGKISEIIKNGEGKSYTDILRKVENLIISQTLELFGGNISKAAKALSLHRATLHRKLRAVS